MQLDLSLFDHNKYLAGCLVIGIFQSIDSLVALAEIKNGYTTAFSLLELLWFLCSLFFLLVFKQKQLSLLLPLIYITYYLFGWFYGSYLLMNADGANELVLPIWYKVFAGLFGVLFFSLAHYFHRVWRYSAK